MSLYADDILLYATKPASSICIPTILKVIEQYSSFSGYRINLNKSELMPVGLKDLSQICPVQFKIDKDRFTYLGIVVTRKFSLLREANYAPLIETFKINIQFWRTLPILLIGRINVIISPSPHHREFTEKSMQCNMYK